MATPKSIITAALRELQSLESGGTPEPDELMDGLESLNMLLSNLSEDRIIIPSRTEEVLTLANAQATYTIGANGDFNTAWPIQIEHAFFRYNGFDYSVDVVGARRYLDISIKTITGAPAASLYYEPSYPLGVLHFNVIPLTTYDLHLTSLKPLTEFATIDDVIDLPKSFERFLKWNLAVEMAPSYGQGDISLIMKHAEDSRETIERRIFSSRVDELVVDNGIRSRGNSYYDVNRGPV